MHNLSEGDRVGSSAWAFPYNIDADVEDENSYDFLVVGVPVGLDTWCGVAA